LFWFLFIVHYSLSGLRHPCVNQPNNGGQDDDNHNNHGDKTVLIFCHPAYILIPLSTFDKTRCYWYSLIMAEEGPSRDIPKEVIGYYTDVVGSFEKVSRLAIEAEGAARLAEYQASHDYLTDALNRKGLKKYLESAQEPKAVLLVDANNFKSINDRYGLEFGDSVIQYTHELLCSSVRKNDIIARWGGDEFVIILNGEDEEQLPHELADERRISRVYTEHIQPVKERIAQVTQVFLEGSPQLSVLGFDLAVGGIVWPSNAGVENLITELQGEMRAHKNSLKQNHDGQSA